MLPPRNSDPTAPVALQAAVAAVCKRWKPVVLWLLLDGPRRYNALLAALDGVTPKVLTEQLRELEREKLVARRVVAGRARHVEYGLTPLGLTLKPVLIALHTWGIAQAPTPMPQERSSTLDQRRAFVQQPHTSP